MSNPSNLHSAVVSGNMDECVIILEAGCQVNEVRPNGSTPLKLAIKSNNLDICRVLLDYGANVNQPFAHDQLNQYNRRIETTPLQFAIYEKNQDICKLFLEKGANVNERFSDNTTPLLCAIRFNLIDICTLLLEKGAFMEESALNLAVDLLETDIIDRSFGRSLIGGSEFPSLQMCQLLLENGAKVNDTTLFHNSNIEIGELLLEAGAKVNDMKNKYGETSLHIAARNRNYLYCQWLLDHDANIHAVSTFGNTPLHCARDYDIYKLLLDRGATQFMQNEGGDTPLHFASRGTSLQCCELLIQFAGFQLAGIKNKKGKKASQFANSDSIRSYLQQMEKECEKELEEIQQHFKRARVEDS